MAKIGVLGDIVFEVSPSTVKTINSFNLSGSASIGTHKRHLNSVLTEFTGYEAEQITFGVKVSQYLGVDAVKEIDKIRNYTKKGTPLKFTLGKKTFGYKWLIKSYKVTPEHYDKKGNIVSADITLSLISYDKK